MRAMMVLAVCGCAVSAEAASVSIPALADATLYQSATGNVANGGGDYLFVGTNSQSNVRRSLISFDIAGAVPAGATITGATLTLNLSSANAAAVDIDLRRVLASWSEGTSDPAGAEGQGLASAAGDVTWVHRTFNSVSWSAQGGDFSATASATASVGDLGSYSWSGAGVVADVQSWLAAPGGNFGWALVGGESGASTAKRFDSRNNNEGGVVPTLLIEYTPVPAPGAGALVALGGLASLRRRRATA